MFSKNGKKTDINATKNITSCDIYPDSTGCC